MNKLLSRCDPGDGHRYWSAEIESGAGSLAEILCPSGQELWLGGHLVHGVRHQCNVVGSCGGLEGALVRPISESRCHLVRCGGQRRPSSTERVCLDAEDGWQGRLQSHAPYSPPPWWWGFLWLARRSFLIRGPQGHLGVHPAGQYQAPAPPARAGKQDSTCMGKGQSRSTPTPCQRSPWRHLACRGRWRGRYSWQRQRPLSAASPPQATICNRGKSESVPCWRAPGRGTTRSGDASRSS